MLHYIITIHAFSKFMVKKMKSKINKKQLNLERWKRLRNNRAKKDKEMNLDEVIETKLKYFDIIIQKENKSKKNILIRFIRWNINNDRKIISLLRILLSLGLIYDLIKLIHKEGFTYKVIKLLIDLMINLFI